MIAEIAAVGGYGEVGRNMAAVKIGEEVVVFDMGLHMSNYIKLTEEERDAFVKVNEHMLKRADAVPQDKTIKDWRDKVLAIVVTHAHLDHVGAVPYVAEKYDAPVICTPFTAAILRGICKDEKIHLSNKIIELKPGKSVPLSKNLRIEFVRTTHSTLQTIIAVLHTPKGSIIYANDYKLDNHPLIGKAPDYKRLEEIGKQGVLLLIQDCIYAYKHRRTPSEQIAKDMLRDVLLDVDTKGKGLLVTTFASHIARLKTITDFGKQIKRKIVFMGRSMAKYTYAAKDANIVDLTTKAHICKYARQTRRKLEDVRKRKDKYLLVVSGHQGEPKSTLTKMLTGTYKWNFANDHVIFAAHVIPADINRQNREEMEAMLKEKGARIFKDVHVSGHSSREDMRDIITMLKPKHLIPAHGEPQMMDSFNELAEEIGYEKGKTLHPITNGQRLSL